MSTAPISQPAQAQPVIAKLKRKSTKPPLIQSAIVAKFSSGQSKSQIAEDLGITRGTVASILSSAEIEQVLLEGRSNCVRMIPRSVRVIGDRLEKGSETAALAILRGTQVLHSQPITVNQTNMQANTWIALQSERSTDPVIDAFVTPSSLSVPAKDESKL